MKIEINVTKRSAVGFVLGAVAATAVSIWAEQATYQATLPSPSGIFRRLITTGDTVLGRDGGRVSVGAATPGSAMFQVPHREADPPLAQSRFGDLYAKRPPGQPKGDLRFFDGQAWRDPSSGGGSATVYTCTPGVTGLQIMQRFPGAYTGIWFPFCLLELPPGQYLTSINGNLSASGSALFIYTGGVNGSGDMLTNSLNVALVRPMSGGSYFFVDHSSCPGTTGGGACHANRALSFLAIRTGE